MAATDTPPQSRSHTSVSASQPRPRRRAPANSLVLMALGGVVLALAVALALRDDGTVYMAAVAQDEVRPGTAVTEVDFTWEEVRIDAEVADRLVLRGDLAEGQWVAANRLAAGELVTQSNVRSPSAPEELRAMSLPVDRAQAVGGELSAGDRIDVIEVMGGDARYLATGVEVLSITGGTDRGLGGGALSDWGVTVAVDAETALTLSRAMANSEVHLTRSTGSTDAEVSDRLEAHEQADPDGADEPRATDDGDGDES